MKNELSNAGFKRPGRGFTLIELLIVVAIIAILTAIAVPNFLEAQTRSKVSRVKADLRTVSTALEAYNADNNSYPDYFSIFNGVFITTPIAYMTSLPDDVFRQADNSAGFPFNIRWYRYGAMPLDQASRYVLESVGPDTDMDTYLDAGSGFQPDVIALALYPGYSAELFSETGTAVNAATFKYIEYDPTNGIVSSGDIFRLSDHHAK